MKTLVVGGGIAGQAVVEAIREQDSQHELTLICAEPRLPYDRVALSTLLASGADPDTLTLRPARLITTSLSSISFAQGPRVSPSQATSRSRRGRRVRTTTSWPAALRERFRIVPTCPVPRE